jgi:hypothetical protein
MDNSCNDIWERRFQAAIERFQDYEEEEGMMEIHIPKLSKLSLNDIIEHRRLNACTLRYADIPEHMVFLNTDTWLKLKFEIVNNRNCIPDCAYDYYDYEDDDIDKEEKKYLRFKDKFC